MNAVDYPKAKFAVIMTPGSEKDHALLVDIHGRVIVLLAFRSPDQPVQRNRVEQLH